MLDIIKWITIAWAASIGVIAVSCCIVSSKASRLEERYRQEE